MVDSSEDKVWLTDFSTSLAHWQVRKHKVDLYPCHNSTCSGIKSGITADLSVKLDMHDPLPQCVQRWHYMLATPQHV